MRDAKRFNTKSPGEIVPTVGRKQRTPVFTLNDFDLYKKMACV
jgi:hypothetical protein